MIAHLWNGVITGAYKNFLLLATYSQHSRLWEMFVLTKSQRTWIFTYMSASIGLFSFLSFFLVKWLHMDVLKTLKTLLITGYWGKTNRYSYVIVKMCTQMCNKWLTRINIQFPFSTPRKLIYSLEFIYIQIHNA